MQARLSCGGSFFSPSVLRLSGFPFYSLFLCVFVCVCAWVHKHTHTHISEPFTFKGAPTWDNGSKDLIMMIIITIMTSPKI